MTTTLDQVKLQKLRQILVSIREKYLNLYAAPPSYGQLEKTNYKDYVFSQAPKLVATLIEECSKRCFRQDVAAEVERMPLEDTCFSILQIIASKRPEKMDYQKVSEALDRAIVTVYERYMTQQRLTTFDINDVRGGRQMFSHLPLPDPIYEQTIAESQYIKPQHFDLQSIYRSQISQYQSY